MDARTNAPRSQFTAAVLTAVVMAVVLAGCTGSPATGRATEPVAAPPSGSPSGATSVPTEAPTQAPTEAPTVAASAAAGTAGPMPLMVGCDPPTPPCALSAGTWVLDGQYSFILGMEFTVPDGWESREQDAGEFNLFPIDHPDDHIFMVKDIAAATTDGTARLVAGVPRTADGLLDYWRQDPNLVVSPSTPATIGDGIDATAVVITVSPDAAFTDPGCPVYPRCADFFTDPRYWDGGVYGVGAPAAVRLYLATIGSASDGHHLFVIGLEGKDEDALERLTEEAAPIIDSIRLPPTIKIW